MLVISSKVLLSIQNEIKERVKYIPGLSWHNFNDHITDNLAQHVSKCPALFLRVAACSPTCVCLRTLQRSNVGMVVICALYGHSVFTYYNLFFAWQYWKISDVCVVSPFAGFSNWKPKSDSQHATCAVAALPMAHGPCSASLASQTGKEWQVLLLYYLDNHFAAALGAF